MNDINKKSKDINIRKVVVESLAEYLGVDYKDIMDEDSILDDLHMQLTDLTDFISTLESKGLEDAANINIKEIETVSDLIDGISLNQPL